jgi:hypothetical protein
MLIHLGNLRVHSQLGNTQWLLQRSSKGDLVNGTEVVFSRFLLWKFVKEFVQMGGGKQELVSCSVAMRTRDVFGRIYFVPGLGPER